MVTHILMVEDDLTFSTMLSTWLRKKGFEVNCASSVMAAVKMLLHGKSTPSMILSDLRLPDHDGLYLLEWMQREGMHIPFIVMTHYADVQNAVEAMKLGAADYISKPVQPDLLLQKIQAALTLSSQSVPSKIASCKGKLPPSATDAARLSSSKPTASGNAPSKVQGIEGHSLVACELYRLASLVAPTPMSVLIIGASGTGKEYVAHRIHEQSTRSDGPFVAIDCGALTKDLAASELFGHVKGAFTGAVTDKTGAFEQASGGTLFLDEVGNLSYDVQVQLLRVLQERRIRRVGSIDEKVVDIRLICATNENLSDAIRQGTFREDLYHRINEFTLHMPLLRDRGNDVIEFARYFLQRANSELGRSIANFTPEAQAALLRYSWPGNLREMRNVVTRAALLSEGNNDISEVQLDLPVLSPTNQLHATNMALKPSVDEELSRIREALQITGGNKSRAAQLLGIDRKTLYNKLKLYGEEA